MPDGFIGVFKDCKECGGTILCTPLEPAPKTCKDHS